MQVKLVFLLLVVIYFIFYFNKKVENFVDYLDKTDLYVRKSNITDGGRGVYASRSYNPGEVIDICPAIEDDISNFKGKVRDYIFGKNKNKAYVAFGFCSLFNHKDDPNAKWTVGSEHVTITATKPIKKDEEIFISYGPKYWETRKNAQKNE